MFVEKTIAELEVMTAEQLQSYKTAEKAHNEAQTKSIIDAEVKAQVEAAKVVLTAEIENQITDKMVVEGKVTIEAKSNEKEQTTESK